VQLSDEQIIARLTQVRGIGRWTVEMLLIFQLRRPDVLPVDDFGVRAGFAPRMALPACRDPRRSPCGASAGNLQDDGRLVPVAGAGAEARRHAAGALRSASACRA